jgi:hypothetical protein
MVSIQQSKNRMQKITQKRKPVSAEAIARIAERGGNVSRFFAGKGKMMPPIQGDRRG